MIDKWFKNDLRDIYEQHTVAVFIDESGDAEFLLKTLGAEYTIQQANTELEELHVKYLVEKAWALTRNEPHLLMKNEPESARQKVSWER